MSTMTIGDSLLGIFDRLCRRYGVQDWWPSDTRFEMMVGAILTQATTWTNASRALSNLRDADILSPSGIRTISIDALERLVYPSGYYNSKARGLKALSDALWSHFRDDLDAMQEEDTDRLRLRLLGINGVGEETADDILLYAFCKPTFVIDNYTRRIFYRLGLAPENAKYSIYRSFFMKHLSGHQGIFAEYHALIVRHGKEACRKKPRCVGCCLLEICPMGQSLKVNDRA